MKDLQNISATAKKLGVPICWLRRKANEGAIPALKVGRSRLLFNVEAVKKAMSRMAAKGGQDE